jgi:hypothetical protein
MAAPLAAARSNMVATRRRDGDEREERVCIVVMRKILGRVESEVV